MATCAAVSSGVNFCFMDIALATACITALVCVTLVFIFSFEGPFEDNTQWKNVLLKPNNDCAVLCFYLPRHRNSAEFLWRVTTKSIIQNRNNSE